MTKDSAIDHSLLGDALVDVVDDIRRSVHGALGTRPWAVAVITRTWSGGKRGVGVASIHVLELDPVPKVEFVGDKDRMGPAGREVAGSVTLSEVSLRYSQAELEPKIHESDEVAYRLTEMRGQRQLTRWYTISGCPQARRGDKEGDKTDWYILLHETSAMGELDGVDD